MGVELLYAVTRAVMAAFPGMDAYNEIPMGGVRTPYAFVSVEGAAQRREGFLGGAAGTREYTVAVRVFSDGGPNAALALETGERLMDALREISCGGTLRASALACGVPAEGGALVAVTAAYALAAVAAPAQGGAAALMARLNVNDR